MVAVLDESVPERVLGDGGRGLRLSVLPQQEINRLLQQSFGRHLPDDPAQQSCRGQDAHLRPVHTQKKKRKRKEKMLLSNGASGTVTGDSEVLTSASAVAP